MQIAQWIAAAVSSSNVHHIFILSLMLNVPRPWMTHILYPQIFNIVVIVVLLKALDDTRPPFTIVSLFIESLPHLSESESFCQNTSNRSIYPASWNNPILHLWRIGKIYVVISEPCVLNNWYLYPHSWRSNTPSCLLLTVSLTTCSSAALAVPG